MTTLVWPSEAISKTVLDTLTGPGGTFELVEEEVLGARMLYVIEDLDEIEPGALWADSKLGFDLGVRHHDAWVRSAIVTDIAWMARASRMFLWMIPGEARVFPLAELDQAKAWVAGAA